ncbi:hypothetical protein IP93_02575 [Lysobacter ruishenii]|uniref:S1/P1 nuclease n=2 Tax=Aerolutibacter ruishenii TaxID=686800 RepID=A0A562LK23_9GAMM|nr:hypothetical protein IP93_02575 [Lysobacter ruishenii]
MSDTLADMARILFVPGTQALAALALATLVALPAPALAWSAMGHRLVAALADDELTDAARSQIKGLLADTGQQEGEGPLQGETGMLLPAIATWADELRANDPELGRRSSPWHYVNLGEHACLYEVARDCPQGNCVVAAITAQTAILADRTRDRAERAQALKFVVHFVGDVHQPMHAGYAHDKGGNTVQVRFNGQGTNLHSLWDGRLLESAGLDEAGYLAHLRTLPVAVPLPARALPPTSAEWAQQACTIATQPGVYPNGAKLPADYADTWRPLAEEQLRRAGTQLALLLNAALTP